jgi:hypothetical protein
MSWFKKKEKEPECPKAEAVEPPKEPKESATHLLCGIHAMTKQLSNEIREGNIIKYPIFLRRYKSLLDALDDYEWSEIFLYRRNWSYLYLMKDKDCDVYLKTVENYGVSIQWPPTVKKIRPSDKCLYDTTEGKSVIYAFTDHYEEVLSNVKLFRERQLNELSALGKK